MLYLAAKTTTGVVAGISLERSRRSGASPHGLAARPSRSRSTEPAPASALGADPMLRDPSFDSRFARGFADRSRRRKPCRARLHRVPRGGQAARAGGEPVWN